MRILAGRLPEPLRVKLRATIGTDWPLDAHALSRLAEKGVSESSVRACLATGRLVECNDNGGPRVLLRDAAGTCIVVGLTTHTVVTVYHNAAHDAHYTLDRAAYYRGPLSRALLTRLIGPC